jgi:hypothetical protein
VHLANLLRDFRSAEETGNVEHELCSYANTLHKFYGSMEKVEQCNFRESMEETINFINNVISEEIRFIVFEKIPSKSLNGSFSFNEGMGMGAGVGNGSPFNCEPSIGESLDRSLEKCMGRRELR